MADNNIIVKIELEGKENLTKGLNDISDVLADIDKAQKMTAGSTDALGRSIKDTITEMNKLISAGETQSAKFKELKKTLNEQTNAYSSINSEIEEAINLTKEYTNKIKNVITGEKSLVTTKKELKDTIEKLILSGQKNTKEYNVAIKTLKILEETSKDSKKALAEIGGKSEAINSFISKLQTTTSVIGLVQGAVGLFGKENELLNQTLVKVNSLMLIGQSLQQIKVALNEKDAITTGVATIAQRGYALAVGSSTGAMKIFRLALVSTGIGALVVGLGLAITAFMKWREEANKASEALKLNNKITDEANENIANERAKLTELLAIARNETLSKQERQRAIEEINKRCPEYLGNLKLETIKTKETDDAIKEQIKTLMNREKVRLLTAEIAKREMELERKREIGQLTFFQNIQVLWASMFKKKGADLALIVKLRDENLSEDKAVIDKLNADLYKTIEDLGNNVFEPSKQAGKKINEGLKNGVQSSKTEVKEVVKSVYDTYVEELRKIENEIQERIAVKFKTGIDTEENKKKIADLRVDAEAIKTIIKAIDEEVNPKEVQAVGFFETINKAISETENKLKELTGVMINEGNVNEKDPRVVALVTQLKNLQGQLDNANASFDLLIGKDIPAEKVKSSGAEKQRALGSGETAEQSLARVQGNMDTFGGYYKSFQDGLNDASSLASDIFARNAEKEIKALEDRRKKGLISEKKYQKELNKIKNEQAQKEKKVRTINAFAMIPMAILSTFTNTVGGLVVKSIAAGIAGAFALANAVMVSTAPVGKYRMGGKVEPFKGSGFVKGKSHSEGGVVAELEGNEFVMRREAVATYGVKTLEAMNNGTHRLDMNYKPLIHKTYQENRDYKDYLMKINNKLEYLYQSIIDGNDIALKVGKKLIEKSERNARTYN